MAAVRAAAGRAVVDKEEGLEEVAMAQVEREKVEELAGVREGAEGTARAALAAAVPAVAMAAVATAVAAEVEMAVGSVAGATALE